MKRTLFSFTSAVGEFAIQPTAGDRVVLLFNGKKTKTFGSARMAAESVWSRRTGVEVWDQSTEEASPNSLDSWKKEEGLKSGRSFRKARSASKMKEG